jgi:hypothetical protein
VMLGQPLDIPFVERDQWVRATVPGALATVVHGVRSAPVFATPRPTRYGIVSLTSRAAPSFGPCHPLVNAFRTPVPDPTAAGQRRSRLTRRT